MELQLLHRHTYDIYLDIEINFLEQLIAETQRERGFLFFAEVAISAILSTM